MELKWATMRCEIRGSRFGKRPIGGGLKCSQKSRCVPRLALFATSSLAAASLAVGGGAFVALLPGAALAQTCTPPPAQGTTAAPQVIGPATQFCLGNYTTGIGYDETTVGGNLTVNLVGPGLVNGGGVLLNDAGGGAANLTLVLGNTTNVGQNIVTTLGSNAVTVNSTGGNVLITTGNNTIPRRDHQRQSFSGIEASTTGNGTVNVSTIANVTGRAGDGIFTTTVNGSNTVTVGGNVVGNLASGVLAVSIGTGPIVVNLGNVTTGAGNATTVTPFSVSTVTGVGVFAVNTGGVGNTSATINVTDPGNVTVSGTTVDVAGIFAQTATTGVGSKAVVNMTGAPGGTVSVLGGGGDFGVGADTLGGGSASVVTNAGRTISVGTQRRQRRFRRLRRIPTTSASPSRRLLRWARPTRSSSAMSPVRAAPALRR